MECHTQRRAGFQPACTGLISDGAFSPFRSFRADFLSGFQPFELIEASYPARRGLSGALALGYVLTGLPRRNEMEAGLSAPSALLEQIFCRAFSPLELGGMPYPARRGLSVRLHWANF